MFNMYVSGWTGPQRLTCLKWKKMWIYNISTAVLGKLTFFVIRDKCVRRLKELLRVKLRWCNGCCDLKKKNLYYLFKMLPFVITGQWSHSIHPSQLQSWEFIYKLISIYSSTHANLFSNNYSYSLFLYFFLVFFYVFQEQFPSVAPYFCQN